MAFQIVWSLEHPILLWILAHPRHVPVPLPAYYGHKEQQGERQRAITLQPDVFDMADYQ